MHSAEDNLQNLLRKYIQLDNSQKWQIVQSKQSFTCSYESRTFIKDTCPLHNKAMNSRIDQLNRLFKCCQYIASSNSVWMEFGDMPALGSDG